MDNLKYFDEVEKLLVEFFVRKGEGEGELKLIVSVFYLQLEEVNILLYQVK